MSLKGPFRLNGDERYNIGSFDVSESFIFSFEFKMSLLPENKTFSILRRVSDSNLESKTLWPRPRMPFASELVPLEFMEPMLSPFSMSLKPNLSIGTWFHWFLARTPQKTTNETENGDYQWETGEVQENLYYFQYRLGETYGTSPKSFSFRNNVWQKEFYKNKIRFFYIFYEIGMTGNTVPRWLYQDG